MVMPSASNLSPDLLACSSFFANFGDGSIGLRCGVFTRHLAFVSGLCSLVRIERFVIPELGLFSCGSAESQNRCVLPKLTSVDFSAGLLLAKENQVSSQPHRGHERRAWCTQLCLR